MVKIKAKRNEGNPFSLFFLIFANMKKQLIFFSVICEKFLAGESNFVLSVRVCFCNTHFHHRRLKCTTMV